MTLSANFTSKSVFDQL